MSSKTDCLQVEHVTKQRELGVCAAECFFNSRGRHAETRHRAQTMPWVWRGREAESGRLRFDREGVRFATGGRQPDQLTPNQLADLQDIGLVPV